ncbi:MAG: GNAT family N-acetyltransferase [Ferrimicrobium sp.]
MQSDHDSNAFNVNLRTIEARDALVTREIYNHAVLDSTATLDLEPRTPTEQERWIQEHLGIYTALIIELNSEVVGFASISPYRPRAGYSSSVEDSIYLVPTVQGHGLGTHLLRSLLVAATDLGFHTCIARVMADSTASLALHQSCGFRLVGIEEQVGRKFGHWLDVAILQRLL